MHKSNIVLMVQRSQMLVLRVDCINHVMIRHLPRHQYTKKDYLSQHNLMLLTQSIWLLDVARKVFLLQKIRCKFLQDQTGISKVIAQNLSMASRTSHTQFKYSFQNLKQIVETGIDQPDFPCCFIKIFGFNSRVYKEQCVLFCYRRRRRAAALPPPLLDRCSRGRNTQLGNLIYPSAFSSFPREIEHPPRRGRAAESIQSITQLHLDTYTIPPLKEGFFLAIMTNSNSKHGVSKGKYHFRI